MFISNNWDGMGGECVIVFCFKRKSVFRHSFCFENVVLIYIINIIAMYSRLRSV